MLTDSRMVILEGGLKKRCKMFVFHHQPGSKTIPPPVVLCRTAAVRCVVRRRRSPGGSDDRLERGVLVNSDQGKR